MRAFLGIDDTDVLGHKPGTGRLARDLAAELSNGTIRFASVVRHQLLVDPRIPYTSHNSPACIVFALDEGADVDALFDVAAERVAERSARGADPGICLGIESNIPDAVVDWGLRAASEVVDRAHAFAVAAAVGVRLRALGGTGDGVIGALAAVGLTKFGNAGRFLDLAGGLRGFSPKVRTEQLYERGITVITTGRNGEPVGPGSVIATDDWVRPRLIGGRPVLLVEPDGNGAWRCFDRKNVKAGDDHGE